MKKNERQSRAERRSKKRGLYERNRKRRNAVLRTNAQEKVRKIKQEMKKGRVPKMPKPSLWSRIKMFARNTYFRLLCLVGRHGWTLHSGLEGTAKYVCYRCQTFSKELWKERKSVEPKYKPRVGSPVFWETNSGKKYNGKIIKLDGTWATVKLKDGTIKEIELK